MQSEIETGTGPVTQNQTTPATRLGELEAIVDKGKVAFLEVGAALIEIHDRELYKERCSTWADYVKQRFGFSRQHAHRLMQAKQLAHASPMGDKPKTEREARARKHAAKKSQPANAKSPSVDLDALFKALEQTTDRLENVLCQRRYRELLFRKDYREWGDRIVCRLEDIIIIESEGEDKEQPTETP
jgi:hypothetical protein